MSSSFPPRCLPPMKIFGTFAIRAIMLFKAAEHCKKGTRPRAALPLLALLGKEGPAGTFLPTTAAVSKSIVGRLALDPSDQHWVRYRALARELEQFLLNLGAFVKLVELVCGEGRQDEISG